MMFTLGVLSFLLLQMVKWLAFASACVLTAVALGVAIRRREHRTWNIVLGVVAGGALVVALCYVPHLGYYIGYGIQSQAARNTRIIECCLGTSLLASLFVPGYRKWISIVAVVCGYVAFAIA